LVVNVGRDAVDREMKEFAGTSMVVLDQVPDEVIDAEWHLLKWSLFDETLIPNRYRALIALAVAAVLRCRYATRLHTEMARVHGASEAEIAASVHQATLVSAWSARMNGIEVDAAEFAAEVERLVSHMTGMEG
jgi:AhpD family alkylhydroperoxidase